MDILGTFRLCYLLGAANALFFSLLVFSKKDKTIADKILGGWLIVLFAQLIIPFLYLADLNVYYKYAGLEIVFYIFHPVLLYLYVRATISKIPGLRTILWSLVPIIISEAICLSFMLYPAEERLLFITGEELLPLVYIPFMTFMSGYFGYYIYASYKSLKEYKNNVLQVYSYRENVDLLWLRRLVVLFALISFLIFPLGLISYYGYHSIAFADYFFFVMLVIFVFFLGYWGYQQGHVFNFNSDGNSFLENENNQTFIKIPVNQNITRHYKKEAEHILQLMKTSMPYLEPSITINDLARMVDLPPHLLSKVINKEFHCNFFEFINSYRIKEFKQRAFSREYRNLTILAIALECGFNSKSAFNRIFKDATGITPSEFIQNHQL